MAYLGSNSELTTHGNTRVSFGYPLALFLYVIGTFLLLYLVRGNAALSDLIGREDGVYEWLGAVFFLCASIAFLCAYRVTARPHTSAHAPSGGRNWFYLLFALAFFFAAGEEISWGQRLFGWELPESVRDWNNKHETNLHNLRPFSRTNEDGIGFGFSRLFNLFVLFYCVLIPSLCLVAPRVRTLLEHMRVPIVPLWLGALYVLNYALSKLLEHHVEVSRVFAIETKESNLALLFFAFGLFCYAMARRQKFASAREA